MQTESMLVAVFDKMSVNAIWDTHYHSPEIRYVNMLMHSHTLYSDFHPQT